MLQEIMDAPGRCCVLATHVALATLPVNQSYKCPIQLILAVKHEFLQPTARNCAITATVSFRSRSLAHLPSPITKWPFNLKFGWS